MSKRDSRNTVPTRQKQADIGAFIRDGLVFHRQGRWDEATRVYEAALRRNKDNFDLLNLTATAHAHGGRFAKAVGLIGEALRIRPQPASAYVAHGNLGYALQQLRRLDEALASYDKAISLKSDYADAHFNRSLLLLLAGRFDEGWHGYEWRKKKKGPVGNRTFPRPLLAGLDDIDGKTVLVHAEQGLGDAIQFCRYARLLQERGAIVLLAPPRVLRRLFASLGGGIRLVDPDQPDLSFDYHVPLMSLPLLLGTSLATIPAKAPYLHADAEDIARWRRRLGDKGLKIGICWQGSPSNTGNARRSFPVTCFASLARQPGVRLISLQKGDGTEQLDALPRDMAVETLGDFDAAGNAFVDTAAVMNCLDLVITSDTSVAHLAGALGVPAWIALNHVPDWRWMLDRADSPWYPSVRLFRQKAAGDWQGVFEEIERALLERLRRAERTAASGAPRAPISWGELIDKITILEIKSQRLSDTGALAHVATELPALSAIASRVLRASAAVRSHKEALLRVNQTLWDIEDRIREKEANQAFDDEFIRLARSVYETNDRRAALKRSINTLLRSELMEEKSYRDARHHPS